MRRSSLAHPTASVFEPKPVRAGHCDHATCMAVVIPRVKSKPANRRIDRMSNLVSWPGQNGQLYRFHSQLFGLVLPKCGGVYISCKMTVEGRFMPFYVGEAQDLHKRVNDDLPDHDGLQCSLSRGATHINFLRIDVKAKRLSLETELRRSLRPPCNRQGVSAAARILAG